MNLTECHDEADVACVTHLASQGALNPRVWTLNDLRIVSSIDPSGENAEWEHHVSVSRNGRPVAIPIAADFAKHLIPRFDGATNIRVTDTATHIWWRKPE